MPGMLLSFSCPCGYRKDDVNVGATETGHYVVYLCLGCKILFSVWISAHSSHDQPIRLAGNCRKCGAGLSDLTCAWEPAWLQRKFPDTEPWLVTDGIEQDGWPQDDFNEAERAIRGLCPACGKYRLQFEDTGFWD